MLHGMCVYFNLRVVNCFPRGSPYKRGSYRNTRGQAPHCGPSTTAGMQIGTVVSTVGAAHIGLESVAWEQPPHYKAEIAVLSEKSTLTSSFTLVILLVSGVLKSKCLFMIQLVYFL